MRKIISGLALSSALICSLSVNAAEHVIKMLDTDAQGNIMVFDPPFIKVNKGDTIKFVATNPGHNNISRHVPNGASSWKGEVSQDVTITVDAEGVYLYECDLHKFLGMVGVIQVGAAKNLDPVKAAADKLTAGMAMSGERVAEYLSMVEE